MSAACVVYIAFDLATVCQITNGWLMLLVFCRYFKKHLVHLQLIISICLYQSEPREERFQMLSFQFTLPFAIPAILYCMTNNLGVHIQLQMDPASYQATCYFNSSGSNNNRLIGIIIMRFV